MPFGVALQGPGEKQFNQLKIDRRYLNEIIKETDMKVIMINGSPHKTEIPLPL